ncbi:MAG: ATP synthase F1 subunit epsilon [Lachnospiraceae bacterium]|nr:ATP synthase F1 subunit epsilon [Lachnospiraceae bacterium]
MAEDNKLFDLEIIAPDRMFYQGKVYFLEMKTSEGEIGVFRGHVPTTAVLVPGLVKIYQAEGEEPKEGVIHGGFVEILQDKVTIMAEIAEWPEEIDLNRAEEARVRAERRINTEGEGIDMDRAEASLRRALARIEALK